MNPPALETDRLNLRPFGMSDAKDVQRLAGSRAIADTTLNIPRPYPDGAAGEWISGHQAELGYWIGEPFWGHGYCTEAAEAVMDYAFGELRLMRVHACHFSRNRPSVRVMQKIGMKHEGRRRHHVMKWGKLEDLERIKHPRWRPKDRTLAHFIAPPPGAV